MYPLTYGLSRSGRNFYLGFGALFIALSLSGVVFFGFFPAGEGSRGLLVVMSLLLLGLGIPPVMAAMRTRVVLHEDEIESRQILRTRRLRRADIVGYRVLQIEGGARIRLESGTAGVGHLMLPAYVAVDHRLDQWLAGKANYDALERQASLDAVLAHPDLMGSDEEKVARLTYARRVARVLGLLSLAAFLWTVIYPRPYDLALAVTALLPVLPLILLASQGALYCVDGMRNEMRASLLGPLVMPGFALTLRALYDTRVLDGWELFWLTLLATALLIAILYATVHDLRRRPGGAFSVGLLLLAYAYGSVSLANVELDRAPPEHFTTQVVGKSKASASSKTFELRVAPWGPRTVADEIDVTRAVHERVAEGDSVCVYLWPGALGVRWYSVWECTDD